MLDDHKLAEFLRLLPKTDKPLVLYPFQKHVLEEFHRQIERGEKPRMVVRKGRYV